MKFVDIPPVWLLASLIAAWWIGQWQPFGLSIAHPLTQLLGGLCVGAGLILMVLAFIEMRKRRTTVIPHMEATALVTSGIFGRSRNPIYLGDVMVLVGLCLRWDALVGLLLAPLLVWVLERRFIIPEEDRLRRKFRADFARYCQKTRRWV